MLRRTLRLTLSFVMLTALMGVGGLATAATPAAPSPAAVTAQEIGTFDACYTFSRTLRRGMSGSDVKQLQIRVAGYPGYGSVLALDGEFGPATESAVRRFQSAYGLTVDGIAGSQTFSRIYALQDGDCSTANFSWSELNRCNSSWSGGAVSAASAKENARRNMWKLQAMRHALGDRSISVSSGFRSYSCNRAVGGSSNSRHLYGAAVDLTGSHSLCTLAKRARYHGFRGILGPGYPGHYDHTHVDTRSSRFWSASNCGI